MSRFRYKARNLRGEAITGILDADSADAVASQLFNTGITPVDIVAEAERSDPLAALRRRLGEGKPSLTDLVLFSRQMHTLMRAGVPILRAMQGLAQTCRSAVMARTLTAITEDLQSGRELAGALSRHPAVFNNLYVAIIHVGENSGRLDEAFLQMAQYVEREKETRDRVKTALRYPVIVTIAILAAIVIINIFVIPAFSKVFSGFHAQLPWATRALIAGSEFTKANWPALLAGSVAGVLGLRSCARTEKGRYRWDRFKLQLPKVGDIIRRATLGRFARSFAMASRSGVPLIQALTVVARAVDNEYVADGILAMRNGIERGETLSRTAQASGLFTPLVLQMLAVGEETGAIDRMLQEVSDFYEREVDFDLKKLGDLIEPILILGIGILVLILALGVFLPMWDLAAAARGG